MFQPLARDALQPAGWGIKGAVDHGIDGFAEAFVFESHALGERAEQIDIGAAFAERLHRLVGNLEVVVAVSGLQIFVLEKGSGGQHDVGVVGGVGEELLVDDGEKIGAHQSADDFVVIGADGRRIRVVDEQRLDRRRGRRVQGACRVAPC